MIPIVLSTSVVLSVFECMHGYPTRLIARDDFCDEEAVAHIFPVIFDGIGEIKPLHPLEDFSGESAFGCEVIKGAAGTIH